MKYAAGSCALSVLNERSSSVCITASNGERFACGASGGMAAAAGLFNAPAMASATKAPAKKQPRLRAIVFKESSLRIRRGCELFSVRHSGRPHKRLPLSMHKDWTGKAAPTLHFAGAINHRFSSLETTRETDYASRWLTSYRVSIDRNERRLPPYRRVVAGLA